MVIELVIGRDAMWLALEKKRRVRSLNCLQAVVGAKRSAQCLNISAEKINGRVNADK